MMSVLTLRESGVTLITTNHISVVKIIVPNITLSLASLRLWLLKYERR